ncbi:MAG: hypothetical protein QXW80_06350 [Candidatus Micrarchaeia archaeon]
MNWKNVLILVSVHTKASRIAKGTKFRRFRENRLLKYALYAFPIAIGTIVGLLTGNFYTGIPDSMLKQYILENAKNIFITIPTLTLLYSLIFTQMNQIQRIGVKVSVEPLYWFPITWKEHTLASIIANTLGLSLNITLFICSAIIVVAIFLNIVPFAFLTIVALLASLFLASMTTEASKIIQIRTYGAINKAAGRAAIWIRFISSIIFFIIFYLIYFSLYYNFSPYLLIEWIITGQKMLWFIPYLWPGAALAAYVSGMWFEAAIYLLSSIIFIYTLFWASVHLNSKFGLYEMPSIKISKGIYVPKESLLGRFGFSPIEVALLKKDIRAIIRRQELYYVFITPVILLVMSLIATIREETAFRLLAPIWYAYLTLLPGAFMAISVGYMIVGSEGSCFLYMRTLPISTKSFIKTKYSFIMLLSLPVAFIGSIFAIILLKPSINTIIIGLLEAVFSIIPIAMISLICGIKGVDFREKPRPRMIRPEWGLVGLIVCGFVEVAIIAPLVPYVIRYILPIHIFSLPEYYIYVALAISATIVLITAYLAYKIALKSAEGLLRKSE